MAVADVALEDRVPVGPGAICIAAVTLADGATDRYALPLLPAPDPVDALDDQAFCDALLDLARGGTARGEVGEVVGAPARGWPETLPPTLSARRVGGEQSNSSVVFGDALILKHFRRLAPGVNPEAEMTRFLTERTAYRHTPALAAVLEYHDGHGR
ncbi:MAG TPA: sugar phosphotransferase, partial [Candidatus Tectomicrobia bacterium]|nr:sugar phosphotransferase [Candidatus Tectomicrobia bacterium]